MTKIQIDSNGKAIMLNNKALEASEGVTPTGTISITENGTYDVANYASADVYVEGGESSVGIPREVTGNGTLQQPRQSFTFTLPSNVVNIGERCLYYAFYNSSGLITVDLYNLVSITGNSACEDAFYGCSNLLRVDLSNLESITSQRACANMFWNCTRLTSISFPKLKILTGSNACGNMFNGCTRLTSVSFPALTSTSFGSQTTQFNNMLLKVSGCTVHFPSNLQSVIGGWSSVTSGFGGTNTTVLFDLPATE